MRLLGHDRVAHFSAAALLLGLVLYYPHATVRAQPPCWETASPVCTDGPSTRYINGVPVTRDCWNYRKSYQCGYQPSVDGCATVRTTPGCALAGSTCTSRDQDGACSQYEYRYECYSEGTPTTYEVCGGDVFCADGTCGENLVTPGPNTFGQSYSTFAGIRAAASSYDPATQQVLPGSASECRKALSGAFDCCGNDGILNDVASCNQEEQDLALANQARRTVFVGQYCSVWTGFPRICVENKWAFCVFDSLLARIIHQQGRPQIPIDWGTPQAPNCRGFTLSEFSQIDFSQIDFSEFAATVTVPAADPNAASSNVQNGIANQQVP